MTFAVILFQKSKQTLLIFKTAKKMNAILLVIEALEAKQDAGTITMTESTMLLNWIEKAENELNK